MLLKKFFLSLFILLSLCFNQAYAQLDTKHYIPPCYTGTDNWQFVGTHWAVLATPSTEPITVRIEKGDGTLVATKQVSSNSPVVYEIGRASYHWVWRYYDDSWRNFKVVKDYPLGVVNYDDLNKVISEQGLIFSSDKPFYVNIRHLTDIHGFSLTSKGSTALGTSFRSGHLYSEIGKIYNVRSHFISVMATEDNTNVTFSEIKTRVITSNTNGPLNVPNGGTRSTTLNAGESYVIAANFAQLDKINVNEFNGTKVSSDKPIVVNSGSWTGGSSLKSNSSDIGIDQIVPESAIGTEYIVVEGKGNFRTERPIIVSTETNTQIYVNGTLKRSLNNIGYLILKESDFINGEMYIKTTKPVYVYQSTSGSSLSPYPTVGMNFIPPVDTMGIREVDIPQIELLGEGVITILARSGANVYKINPDGTSVPLFGSHSVDGNPDWVYYNVEGLTGDVKFVSDKAIFVALVTQSDAVGAAGYYSGFTKKITPIVPNVGVGGTVSVICVENEDGIVLSNTGDVPSFYSWYDKTADPDLIISKDPQVAVNPDVTNTYLLKAYYRDPNLEILINQDFEWGNLFFDTDGSYHLDNNLNGQGDYYVDVNPNTLNGSLDDVKDHTSGFGKMMIVRGNTSEDVIWKSEEVVEASKDYIFSFWGRQIAEGGDEKLQLFINGEALGDPFTLDDRDNWQNGSVLWSSGASTTAKIEIRNLNTDHSGIFALDDISFLQSVLGEGEFTITVMPKVSYTPLDEETHFCLGTSFNLNVSKDNSELFTYHWTKDGKEILQSNVSGKNSAVLSFSDPDENNQGKYECRIVGTTACGNDEVTTQTNLVMVTPIVINSIDVNHNLCEREPVIFNLDIDGVYDNIKWYKNGVEINDIDTPNYTYYAQHDDGDAVINCVVSGACGSESWAANLHVFNSPQVGPVAYTNSVCEGEEALFHVDATGNGGLHYQWYRGVGPLSKETSSSYSLITVHEDNNAEFYCAVSDDQGCENSSEKYTLEVKLKPVIEQPKGTSLCVGDSYVLSVGADAPMITYQWQKDKVDIPGANGAGLVLNTVQLIDAGKYRCLVEGVCGVTSDEAIIIVNERPSLSEVDDLNVDKCPGTGVSFAVTPSGRINSYRWDHILEDGVTTIDLNINAPTINLTNINDADAGNYRCTAIGPCGEDYVEYTLNVLEGTKISKFKPDDLSKCPGESFPFNVVVNGSGMSYEWDHDGAVVGGNKSSFLVKDISDASAGIYTVTVKGACGVVSASSKLTVNKITEITHHGIDLPVACEGETVNLFVTAVGANLNYQWYKAGVPIAGETSDKLQLVDVAVAPITSYKCIVTGDCGTDEESMELTVNPKTAITTPLTDKTVCADKTALFSVTTEGSDLSYIWSINGVVDNSIAGSNYLVGPFTSDKVGDHDIKVEVHGNCENKESSAKLTVKPLTEIQHGISDQQVCVGTDVTFTVAATGDEPTYQWYKGVDAISGQTNSSLSLLNVQVADAGSYKCVVSGGCTPSKSTTAELIVWEPIVQQSGISDISLCRGVNHTFEVDYLGSDLKYQWRKNDGAVLGTENRLLLEDVQDVDQGTYSCRIYNDHGCFDEAIETAILTLNSKTEITTQPFDQEVCDGDPVTFTVAATGDGAIFYQWMEGANDISGATSASFTIPSVNLTDNNKVYKCKVTSGCGSEISTHATLTVYENVSITTHPNYISADENSDVTFIVDADGAPTLQYKWYKVGDATVIGDKAQLTISNINMSMDGNEYYCVVTSSTGCGSVNSNNAKLHVIPETTIVTQPDPVTVCEGEPAIFEVEAQGEGLLFNWYEEGDPVALTSTEVVTEAGPPEKIKSKVTVISDLLKNGRRYYCDIKGNNGDVQTRYVFLTVNPDTRIDAADQPKDQTVCPGSNATFVVNATGTEPISYEWFDDGGNSVGNSKTLTIVGASAEGDYYCRVTGGCSTIDSDPATLSLYQATAINSITGDATPCEGSDIVLDANVTSEPSGTTSYQWMHGGEVGTGEDLSIDDISLGDEGTYTLTVTGMCGVVSSDFSIDVKQKPRLDAGMDPVTVCDNLPADMVVNASGDDLKYKWFKEGVEDGSVTGNIFHIDNAHKIPDMGAYKCEVSSDWCGATMVSTDANLTVKDPVSIITPLDPGYTFCETDTEKLEVVASGDDITYVWSHNGVDQGVNANLLPLDPVLLSHSGNYNVKLIGYCNSLTNSTKVDINKATNIITDLKGGHFCVGDNVDFSVLAEGTNVKYLWKLDGVAKPLVVVSTYSIAEFKDLDVGPHTIEVTVSGDCGTDQVSAVNFEVHPLVKINNPILDQAVCEGSDVTFTVDANDYNTTYKWFFGATDLGKSSKTLTLNNVDQTHEGTYKCVVSGGCGVDQITQAKLTVWDPLKLNSGLNNKMLCLGDDYNLKVDYDGSALKYEWKKDGGAVISTDDYYSISSAEAADVGNYTCRIYSSAACLGEVTESCVVALNDETVITDQPDDIPVCEGQTATFTTLGTGEGSVTYQWLENGTEIAGATSNSYTTAATTIADNAKEYRCRVTADCGDLLSDKAVLTVNKNVSIVTHPQEIIGGEHKDVTFTVVADGAPTLQYAWYKNGEPAVIGTGANLVLSNLALGMDGNEYYCVVTSSTGCGSVTSDKAKLTVNETTLINTMPSSKVVCEGDDATYIVEAQGTNLTFSWYKDGEAGVLTSFDEEKKSTLTVAGDLSESGSLYYCKIHGDEGDSETLKVSLTVNPYTRIDAAGQPKDQIVCPGSNATFVVNATGTSPLSYEWFDNGGNSVGINAKTLTVVATAATEGDYYCKVTGGCFFRVSNPATLSLYKATVINSIVGDATPCEGSDILLNADVTSEPSGTTSYQWMHGGEVGTGEDLSIDDISLSDEGTYTLTVTGMCGVVSSDFSIDVKQKPRLNAAMDPVTVCDNLPADMVVNASGDDLKYKWFKEGAEDGSVTVNTFHIDNAHKIPDAGNYKCEVTSDWCGVTMVSTNADLIVKNPVNITTPLDPGYTFCETDNEKLEVVASGDDITYEWSHDGVDQGVSANFLPINSVLLSDAGNYNVKVIGYCNSQTSSTKVDVNKATNIITQLKGGDFCVGANVDFSVHAEGTNIKYSWKLDGTAKPLVVGSTYSIAEFKDSDVGPHTIEVTVSGDCGADKLSTVNFEVHPLVKINTPISDQAVCEGSDVTFTVDANDYNTTYKWFFGATDLGKSSKTLTLNNVDQTHEGTYKCVVSGGCGADQITEAKLTVWDPLNIKSGLANKMLCLGDDYTLEVVCEGSDLKYEWKKDGGPVIGTDDNYSISSAKAADVGNYTCRIYSSAACLGEVTESSVVALNAETVITGHPIGIPVCEGETAKFTALGTGTGTVTYQWLENGTEIAGATFSSYTTAATTIADNGKEYRCRVTADCGDLLSDIAILTVNKNVSITTPPVSVIKGEGGDVTFSVVADGAPTLEYNWYKSGDGTVLSTTANLTLSNITTAMDGNKYYCVVTSKTSCGSETTDPVTLDVQSKTQIITQPESVIVCEDEDAVFQVKVEGESLNIEWYKEGDPAILTSNEDVTLIGSLQQITSSLTVNADILKNGDRYYCEISGANGDVSTSSVLLTVNPNTVISDQPEDNIVCPGTSATFTVTATGTAPISYQWKDKNDDIVGNSRVLTLEGKVLTQGDYYCVVTGHCSDVNSDPAKLSLYKTTEIKSIAGDPILCEDGSTTLIPDVEVEDTPAPIYQWTHKGSTFNSKDLSVSNVDLNSQGIYTLKVTGRCGDAYKDFSLDVKQKPTITQNLLPLIKCEGEEADMVIDASGDDLQYTWFKDGVEDNTVTGKIYHLDDVKKGTHDGTYKCEVTNAWCTSDKPYTQDVFTIKEKVKILTPLDNLVDPCEGSIQQLLVDATGDGPVDKLIYSWSKDGSGIGLDQNSYDIDPVTQLSKGNYTVSVEGYCNTLTSSAQVKVKQSTSIVRGFSDGDYCEGDNILLDVYANGTDLHFAWFKDGNPIGADNPRYIITKANAIPANSGMYKCVVTSDCNPAGEIAASGDIQIHPIPQITLVHWTDNICEGNELIFENDVVGDNLTYSWTINGTDLGGLSEDYSKLNAQPAESGLYSLKISGYCGSDIVQKEVLVKENTQLIDKLTDQTPQCEGTDLSLFVTAKGYGLKYQWSHDGTPIDGETTNKLRIDDVIPDNSGIYKCNITSDGCGDEVTSASVMVHPTTILKRGMRNARVCEGEPVSLDVDVQGYDVHYAWQFGSTPLTGVDANNISYHNATVDRSGWYIVKATGQCGEVNSVGTINVLTPATLVSQSPLESICETELMTSMDVVVDGDEISYQWQKDGVDMPGEIRSVLTISPILLDNEGEYKCLISSSNVCDSHIASKPAYLKINARVELTKDINDQEVCMGGSVIFTVQAKGEDLKYVWKKDDVVIPGAITNSYEINDVQEDDAGYYQCFVSSSCGDEVSSSRAKLDVHFLPVSQIIGRDKVCENEHNVLYMSPINPSLTYFWDVDHGRIISDRCTQSIEIDWGEAAQGNIYLTVVSINNGCQAQINKKVDMMPLPNVALAPLDTLGACNSSFVLTGATPQGGLYHVNGVSSEIFDMNQGPGEYEITYSYTGANGCSAKTPIQKFVVMPIPYVKAQQNTVTIGACENTVVSAVASEDNYIWSPSLNLNDANAQNPLFTPGQSQRLHVRVSDKWGCTAQDYVDVKVDALPKVKTIEDVTIGTCEKLRLDCQLESCSLTKVQWTNPGDLDHPDALSPYLERPQVGTSNYTVEVEDEHGCKAKDDVTVNVVAAPDLGADHHLCEGEEVTINVDSRYKSLSWDDDYIGSNRVLRDVGTYAVSVEDEYGCGDKMEIVIHPTPNIQLRDTFIFIGQSIVLDPLLDVNYGPYEYQWQDGSINPTLVTSIAGIYDLSVKDIGGCAAHKQMELQVKKPYIKAPNAFLPETMGDNSRFYVKEVDFINEFKLYIYDRWGEMIFKSSQMGYDGGWNGTFKGKKCMAGAYVWMIFDDGKMIDHGSVTLIR